MARVWTDTRGSEVLERHECLRLLSLHPDDGGPSRHPGHPPRSGLVPRIGRVGFSLDGVPIILPVNYGMVDGDVVVRTGEGVKLLSAIDRSIVAFEVDAVDLEEMLAWSVLVRGLCTEMADPDDVEAARRATPAPLVSDPGDRYLRIRTGVLTGRRFPLTAELGATADGADGPRHTGSPPR